MTGLNLNGDMISYLLYDIDRHASNVGEENSIIPDYLSRFLFLKKKKTISQFTIFTSHS